ncbi:hypothetical protein AMS68_007392 [Peltaster fructicola]|uniref:Transcription factor BYE1 n=1 Tax=Peltaster fructicola TaxID=286661 RepID=A0A6H0Y4M2_9PEZI|nr:hypothetical protein AMS68_007392 [Peltaster fructicola]
MSGDEPRRSGRATKGQHNKHSSNSPGPGPKPEKKPNKKGKKAAATETQSDAEDDAEEVIRCICGNEDPSDKRAFIGCDACSAWQHNVCMGMPDDEDEVGEHYFCEQCRPEEHGETLEALAQGEKIWELRNKLFNNDKKKGKGRKSKGGTDKPAWLKRELKSADEVDVKEETPAESKESGKRKRSVKEETEEAEEAEEEKPIRPGRQDKRRKSESVAQDPDTALVPLDKLPSDRQKIAKALSTLLADDIKERVTSKTYKLAKNESAQGLGEHHALRIEYALHINHGGPAGAGYIPQFRTLNANLKKNKTLIQELLAGHLTADELSTMSSSDMASEELQKERAEMKAESDRQTVIDQRDDGPRYRRTHKGDEIVEAEAAASSSAPIARPVRHSVTEADMAGSPVNTAGSPVEGTDGRPASKETFDMKGIWAKTGTTPARPSQTPVRSRSLQQNDGIKVDADVDRLLADDDDDLSRALPNDIVWRGKIVATTGDHEPTVNARWIAGRDVSRTVPWRSLLADKLNIDGRLQIDKAEEYLCGLQWSKTSDVSVLALTPFDDADAFDKVFAYFKSRGRYAVVNKDKPALLVKDLYIIPVDVNDKLPRHIEMLEHCTIKQPAEEKLLLATFVVSRAPVEAPPKDTASAQHQDVFNGHLPAQIQPAQGPPSTPMSATTSQFPQMPSNGTTQYHQGYSAPQPYQPPVQDQRPLPPMTQEVRQWAYEILGDLVYCETAYRVLEAEGVTRDMIVNMRRIFEEDLSARTDFAAFLGKLDMASS